jgi:hypothetical protein
MNIGYTNNEASMIPASATVAYCPALDPCLRDAQPTAMPQHGVAIA